MSNSTVSKERSLGSPLFIACGLVLLAAAIGMRPAIGRLVTHFSKEPIELRRSLDLFSATSLPSFREVLGNPGFVAASSEDIGTDDWMELPLEPKGVGSPGHKGNLLLFVTYYSDPRDSIPHTPEVCYRQSGGVVERMRTTPVTPPMLGVEIGEVQARLLDIDQQGRKMVVMYVICCNGKMFHGRERARLEIGMPGDRYTYFSKIEVVAGVPPTADREATVEQCTKLLGEATAVLVRDYFPTREQVKR